MAQDFHMQTRQKSRTSYQESNAVPASSRSLTSDEQRRIYGDPGSNPDPQIYAARIKELKSERSAMISALNIDAATQDKLSKAFDEAGLWPSHLLYAKPRAVKTSSRNLWNEQDSRTLLLIQRTVPELTLKQLSETILPGRTGNGIVKRRRIAKDSIKSLGWDEANDRKILDLYEEHGEGFRDFAESAFRADPPFTKYDLDKIHAAANDRTIDREIDEKLKQKKKVERSDDEENKEGEEDEEGDEVINKDEEGVEVIDEDEEGDEAIDEDEGGNEVIDEEDHGNGLGTTDNNEGADMSNEDGVDIGNEEAGIARAEHPGRQMNPAGQIDSSSHYQSSLVNVLGSGTPMAGSYVGLPSTVLYLEQRKTDMIAALSITNAEKLNLHTAFQARNLWPNHLQTDYSPEARIAARLGEWTEFDTRALLLFRRVVPMVDIRSSAAMLFPGQPPLEALRVLRDIETQTLWYWQEIHDEWLVEQYSRFGEVIFEYIATHGLGGRFTASDLEKVYAGARRRVQHE